MKIVCLNFLHHNLLIKVSLFLALVISTLFFLVCVDQLFRQGERIAIYK